MTASLVCLLSCEDRIRCDPETDEPCPACTEATERYWKELEWECRASSPAERDPEGYRRDIIEGGRGHLLRDDER